MVGFFALLRTAANAREGKEHWGSAQIVRPPIRVRDAQCTCWVQDGRCKKVDHVDIGVYLLESGTYDFGFI